MQSGSTCQIEVDVDYRRISCIEKIAIAPIRIFSFDIECWNQEGKGFPRANKNPVIQIAVHLKEQGSTEPVANAIWTLKSCNDIAGAEVLTFETEAEMLMSFSEFLAQTDPDIITGYNIINFDLPYLLERAEALGLPSFPRIGRVTRERARVRTNNSGG